MAQITQDPAQRRAQLSERLADARGELATVHASLDRYEKALELPRILMEINHLELEIQDIDES